MYCYTRRHVLRNLMMVLATGVLAPQLQADEPQAETFDFSREDIAENLILITCEVQAEKRKGNGVIVRMEGKPYLLTNLHILLGAEKITFMNAEGKRMLPRRVELANSRDLVRLSLGDEAAGLAVSSQAKMNTPIAVYAGGNGLGQKVEHGKVIGIGSSKIEISAAFDDSSAGAPALNADKEVVGIATYSREFRKHAMKIGTRFEDEARHFCSRMGRSDWKPVNWKAFNATFGKAYRKHEALCERVIHIFNDEEVRLSQKKARALASECRTHSRQLRLLCEKPGLTEFLRRDFEERAELLEYAGDLFDTYGKSRH